VLGAAELAVLLAADPHADNATAIEPAIAQAAKARRPRVDKHVLAGCISRDS
jgi:hypothetical protein